jgi:hypothetical protein
MLRIGGFLAKFTSAERHKGSPIRTVRASGKTPDPAERERQHWEAIKRGLDEVMAQMAHEPEQRT